MRKTGNTRCLVVLLLLACGWLPAFGQGSVSVEATVSETTLFTGERLKLDITVSGDFSKIARPQLPSFPGFQLLSNTPSTSRSISYVNGVTTSSYTYSYYLSPEGEGSYRIPPVTVAVDGKDYQTDPIDVQVVDRQEAANSNSADGRPDLFLRMQLSDSRPVTGEQLIVDVVLFFKEALEVRSYQPIPGWKAQGFWKEELQNSDRPQVQSTILNGVRYRTARLLQFALFPTKAGELTISPYQVRVSVRPSSQRDDPFSSFFGGIGSNQRQVELQTDPVTVNVQPLPAADTSNYIGAVGSFNISRSVDTNSAEVGESIEIETRISGTGNVPLISKPEYRFPDGLEVYEPQESSTINRRNHKISGTKTYTDIVVARTPGTFTIPETRLAYYHPGRGEYVTETLAAHTITVKANPNAVSTGSQPEALSLQPVTGLASWVSPASESPADQWWLWAGLLLPLVLLAAAYWQKSYRHRMRTDRAFARARQADEKARKRLDAALEHSENNRPKEAYNALQKALTGYISDRLGLPEAGLSIEQYVTALEEQKVNDDLIKNVRMLLNKCATINYAPDSSQDYLKSHVGLAESIIQKLKKEL